MAIHEVLVLKSDGRTERFPVTDGDVAQAELRASLTQRPGDEMVVVTDHAYIRSKHWVDDATEEREAE